MEPEAVITLFDFYWFNLEILKKSPNPSSSSSSSPELKINENDPELEKSSTRLQLEIGSRTEIQSPISGYNLDSLSPVSVLPESHFGTQQPGRKRSDKKDENKGKRRRNRASRRKEKNESLSKSLSELEFEELKGFMDLGFEFSEKDINSSLVEIIPGLQKLGKKADDNNAGEVFDKKPGRARARARPYLSEAWEAMEKERIKINRLMNWRIPAMNNEIDMKDSLRWWAHTVASTVI